MTAEQVVRAKWPDAKIWTARGPKYCVMGDIPRRLLEPRRKLLNLGAWHNTEAAAWQDAASRIQDSATIPATE
jgi:hypothetical protein